MNGEHWRDYFDSQYLGSWDLPRDRDVVVTITKVEKGDLVGMKGKKDKKAIIYFKGKEKALAANRTNCKAIAAMYGNSPRGWIGKSIAMYVLENCDSPQGPVDAIRVRPRIPQQPAVNGRGGRREQPASEPSAEPESVAADHDAADEWVPEEPPMGALETDHVRS